VACRAIYDAVAGPVHALACRLVGRAAADDVFQDAMMRSFERLADYRAEAPFGSWVRAISVNACLMHLRSPWHRLRGLVDELGVALETAVADGSAVAGLELATMTPGLGRYFGTDRGVLVVRAPRQGDWKLEDGDVILAIDGREPTSGAHATRILRSYQRGEALKLRVMRQRKSVELAVTVPEPERVAGRRVRMLRMDRDAPETGALDEAESEGEVTRPRPPLQ
jgi:hypothetical protein